MSHLRALLLAALASSCGAARAPDAGDFSGVDDALSQGCVRCHQAEGARWALDSSHHLLFDCSGCHSARGPDGSHHMSTRTCADCHSQAQHHTVACGACHDVHGAENLMLLRPALGRFSVAQGEAPGGLASQGEGPCEVCHTRTAFYRADGGAPHDGTWCISCHGHAAGFAALP